MAKLTRSSYKRKIIMFGALIFASIALVSTGFAAWVMSTSSNNNMTGNITTGQVTDSSLKIQNLALSSNNFSFEPTQDDTTGRVRNDGSNYESLTTTVTATISPTQYIKEIEIKLIVSDSVKKAATEGYIVLPDYAYTESEASTATGKVITITSDEVQDSESYNLSETITITWGKKFNNKNPGIYYDSDETGKNISDADVKKALEDFRAVIYGYDNALNSAEGQDARNAVISSHASDTLSFKVIIEARAN